METLVEEIKIYIKNSWGVRKLENSVTEIETSVNRINSKETMARSHRERPQTIMGYYRQSQRPWEGGWGLHKMEKINQRQRSKSY